jgi:hypothetical protein
MMRPDRFPKTRQMQGSEAIVALQGENVINLAFENARTLASGEVDHCRVT